MRLLTSLWLLGWLCACGADGESRTTDKQDEEQKEVELDPKHDSFSFEKSFAYWSRVWKTEQWPHDQLEVLDMNTIRKGWLTMVPYASGWYENYRGVLMYQSMQGNFVATTSLEVRNRAGSGPPNSSYSLAGIMVRAPKTTTATTWQAGQEDYIFLSLGSADEPGNFQTEVKTTNNSVSILEIESSPGGDAIIQTARIGEYFILLIKFPNQAWRVHRRFHRADMPAALQVGMTAYTDWDTVQAVTPEYQNTHQLAGHPDLRAQFDYFYLDVPQVPESLIGADFTDALAVPNELILSFLGDHI